MHVVNINISRDNHTLLGKYAKIHRSHIKGQCEIAVEEFCKKLISQNIFLDNPEILSNNNPQKTEATPPKASTVGPSWSANTPPPIKKP